ncbi:serine protease Do [Sinobaca qinghaiensis]|uniref:Serine protease Do n=1 Tax=Sinobaca qinghaiensis TaxID=342944 RepID=A0A419V4L0_9BACL|nr:trypsin-like peptidase domain-containing protein [Sinobaca qinghaiensis]RKD73440.1 serine protease Do [Sinobaca qinghaiensis]
MGYYKEKTEGRTEKKTKRGYFLSSLSGLAAGAVIMMAAGPQISGINESGSGADAQTSGQASAETVSYDVNSDVTDAVDKTSDAIVGVTNLQAAAQNGLYQESAGNSEETEQEAGTGSGVIYKKDGGDAYVVTNNHVVEGADQVEITLADGTKKEAEVLGEDVWTDLAVLKVDGKGIETIAEFGDSSVLKSGEPVIAIGNPLGEQFSGSVTTGVISGTERSIPIDVNEDGTADWQSEVIQTDAAINPGNSGGALINSQGQVIGINSMKIAQEATEGIGLAIPINSAQPIINDLESNGEVERPALGVALLDLTSLPQQYQQQLNLPEDRTTGAVVQSVEPGSAAESAGMEELDVITGVDDEEITSMSELRQYVYTNKTIGDNINVTIIRDGKEEQLTLTLDRGEQL